jgi:membrane protease subunit HflK
MGVKIELVTLQDVNPPEPVQSSFNDVNAAKQEAEQLINRAEANYNKVIPEARGKAEEEISNARGYATATINRARGDAEKLSRMLKEYRTAPDVTRTRLYLETMEELLGRFKNVTIVDPEIRGVLPLLGKFAAGSEANSPVQQLTPSNADLRSK